MEKEQQFAKKQENTKSFKERCGDFSRNHSHIKIGLSIVVCLCVMLFIVFGIPSLLHLYLEHNNFSSKASADAWISSLGSYFGGILGGVCTLVGVVYTINKSKEETEREKAEQRKTIHRKSALLVYYDFAFAFENINEYLKNYTDEDLKEVPSITDFYITSHAVVVGPKYKFFSKNINCFTQLYLQENWISAVAELSDANYDTMSQISNDDLHTLYQIYGNLSTIKKWVDNDTPENCKDALSVIVQMKAEGKLDINNGELYQKIKFLAFTNGENS